MREWLVAGLVQGRGESWALVAGLWMVMAALIALRGFFSRAPLPGTGPGSPGSIEAASAPRPLWLFALLSSITAASLAALPLASALAIPRVRWKPSPLPALVAPYGETWRRLRGPAVQIQGSDGLPDLAVPVLDDGDRWVLFGLLSGAPVPGLLPAPPAPVGPGDARICRTDNEACRPWPTGWPDPLRPLQLGDSVWSKEMSAAPLAYDVESGLYLRQVNPPDERARAATAAAGAGAVLAASPDPSPRPMLEVIGRLSTSAPREGMTALFIVRRIAGGRLWAMRVISSPSETRQASAAAGPTDGGPDADEKDIHTFFLQRASADLDVGRRVYTYFARPALWLAAFALPAGLFASLLAPLWLAVGRRRSAGPSSSGPASLVPSRRNAFTWMSPAAASLATFAAGLTAAAPAAVALASLWGTR